MTLSPVCVCVCVCVCESVSLSPAWWILSSPVIVLYIICICWFSLLFLFCNMFKRNKNQHSSPKAYKSFNPFLNICLYYNMQRRAEITCKNTKKTKMGNHIRGEILKLLWIFCTICHCPLTFLHLSTSFRDSQFSSVAQWCPTLCDPVDWSMPDFPVQHQLPGLSEILITSNVLCIVFRVIFLKISLWPLWNINQLNVSLIFQLTLNTYAQAFGITWPQYLCKSLFLF